jgi:hypothetical protein
MGALDLHDAVEDHMNLHQQVVDYGWKPDGALKADDVQGTDRCELGKWLPAEGAAHQSRPEHGKLADAHAAFHQACADTVRHADAGTLPPNALGDKGALHAAFVHLCISISRLNVKIQ